MKFMGYTLQRLGMAALLVIGLVAQASVQAAVTTPAKPQPAPAKASKPAQPA